MSTTKPILRFVIICFAVCVGSILILYAIADKPNRVKNGFIRNVRTGVAFVDKSIDVKYANYYIAGITEREIFLGNFQAPLHLLRVDRALKDTQSLKLTVSSPGRCAWDKTRIIVNDTNIYVAEGETPAYFRSTTRSLELERFFEKGDYFVVTQNISPSSFISRTVVLDENKKGNNAILKSMQDTPYVHLAKDALKPQLDGIYSTDGVLSYDKGSHTVVYTYRFRNEFITLDTNLNVLLRGHTIDTNRTAKIRVTTTSKGESLLSAPPNNVNALCRVSGSKLYILSTLLSDNEEYAILRENNIIDVYDLTNGKYLYSFYVPRFEKSRLYDFQVRDNSLYALYNHHLQSFRLDHSY
jgi:hypothetical protein